MRPPLRLCEHRPREGIRLSTIERDLLRELVPDMGISPMPGERDMYTLTPSSTVGVVRIGDLAIEIRPKVEVAKAMFLLTYGLEAHRWPETGFDFQEEHSLVEAIVPGFLHQIDLAVRGGLLQGYRQEEDALQTVRGRIRIDEQLKRRFGIAPPIEVAFDEYTEDIDENRLIKGALDRLRRMPLRWAEGRRRLRRFDALLERVSPMEFDPRNLPEIVYTRLNERYRGAVELAKLILRSTAYEMHHGGIAGAAFLVDMNTVFENFVVVALRESLRLDARSFPQGARGKRLRLDRAGVVPLQPDISWWADKSCLFVGDVKYKRTARSPDLHDHHNPDLYQLLAYLIAADLPEGMLIYAAGEAEPLVHEVVHVGKRLRVVTLDLGQEPSDILRRIDDIAHAIRQLARQAVLRAA